MTHSSEIKKTAWYRNPMVWMVIFFPSLAVVGGISTIFIAINTEDGLVVDDYYKQGLQINQVIKNDQHAKQLHLSALFDANVKTGLVKVSLKGNNKLVLPQEITFKLIHRTRSGLDQITTLRQVGKTAEYQGYIKPPVIAGRWVIQIISPDNWRLKQRLTTRSADRISINISS